MKLNEKNNFVLTIIMSVQIFGVSIFLFCFIFEKYFKSIYICFAMIN